MWLHNYEGSVTVRFVWRSVNHTARYEIVRDNRFDGVIALDTFQSVVRNHSGVCMVGRTWPTYEAAVTACSMNYYASVRALPADFTAKDFDRIFAA